MRILAIDHGTVRLGIAVSDELGMIALPLDYIPAEPADACVEKLRGLIAEKTVTQLIVGMPRNMNGTYGPQAEKVRAFVAMLKGALQLPIRTWDERLTSAQANRVMLESGVRRERRKEKVDSMAAAILLQSFLDCQST
ncbi:MAG: Holliday junction resolvase RuvX [Verrucomicrobia bacterium]|nr:Holliday junction resolvase RuvX [Verrucomicrobiota bacterium]